MVAVNVVSDCGIPGNALEMLVDSGISSVLFVALKETSTGMSNPLPTKIIWGS